MIEDFLHLPPVSLTPVANLKLLISPRLFEKIRNDPNGILRGLGETDSRKKTRSRKSRDTVPLTNFFLLFLLLLFLHSPFPSFLSSYFFFPTSVSFFFSPSFSFLSFSPTSVLSSLSPLFLLLPFLPLFLLHPVFPP